jgi:hypothetical protein
MNRVSPFKQRNGTYFDGFFVSEQLACHHINATGPPGNRLALKQVEGGADEVKDLGARQV